MAGWLAGWHFCPRQEIGISTSVEQPLLLQETIREGLFPTELHHALCMSVLMSPDVLSVHKTLLSRERCGGHWS